MGFLDELLRGAQETAARAYNQANPFDGGKNWNTPVARPAQRPQQRPQQQRPQPQFSPQVQQRLAQQDMALKQSQAAVLNPMNILGDISRATQTAGQGIGSVVTGTVDSGANLLMNGAERGAEVIREFSGQNQADFNRQQQMAAEYRRMAESFAQRAQQETDPRKREAYVNQIRSLATAESDLLGQQAQDINRGLNATDPRKVVSDSAETILNVATAGRGAALMKGLQPAATQVSKQSLKQLGANTARVGGEGAGLGAAYGGINTARDENATLQDYARNMGTGAAIGAAAGVGAQAALPVAGAAIRGGANQVRKGVELHNSLTPAQKQGGFAQIPGKQDQASQIDTTQYVNEMTTAQKQAQKGSNGLGEKTADFKEKFMDDLAPIEDRLNKAIKSGVQVDPKDHITYQLDRSRRAEGITDVYMNDHGLAKIVQDVPDTKEFDQYLIARHAKELDDDIKTGRDPAKDAALVQQLDAKYGAAAQELYKYNQKLLDSSVEYGLISKETAKQLKKQYPEYVPFNRIFNEDELTAISGGNGKGNASISKQTVVQKIKGSDRAIASPLNSIIDKTRLVVEQGERNRAAQLLASYKDFPDNPFNLKELTASESANGRPTISFLDNGKKRTFLTDKDIAEAAKNMTREEIGMWGRIAAMPARLLRGGATTLNVGFAGANVVKDVVGAAINSRHPFRIADPEAFGKALSAALHHNGKHYQELMREGVTGTSFDMYRDPLKSNVAELRSHKNLATRTAYNATHPEQWLRTLENTIGRSEDFGRALQYYSNKKGFKADGKNATDATILAADQARSNSTNFFRHGSVGKNINMAIPYWNAGVQGARIQARRVKERPVQTLAKIGFAIAAPSAMIAMNNYSDETKREVMANIPDYEQEGNIIIVGPDAKLNPDTGKWEGVTKIPVPPQHMGIHMSIQNAVKTALTGEAFNAKKNIGRVVEDYTTLNPLNPTETLTRHIPQALKLVAEPMTNTNFYTGNKIVPDSQKNLPAADQYSEYSSGTAKVVGKLTNTSPRMIDNTVRTGFGGAGQNVINATDSLLAATGVIKKDEVRGRSIPDSVMGRFQGANAISPSDKAETQLEKFRKIVIESDAYKKADQQDKAKMLNRLETDVKAVEWDKAGKSDDKLTKKQESLKQDGFKADTYTDVSKKSGKSTEVAPTLAKNHKQTIKEFDGLSEEEREKKLYAEPDAEFRIAAAKYENEKASGTMTPAKRIEAEDKLVTLQVGSKFSKDVRDLYGLNKSQLATIIENGELTNDQAEKILAMDDAMVAAGKKRQWRDKYGNVAFIPQAKGSGGGRKKGTGKGKGSKGGKSTIPTSTVTASLVSFSKSANSAAKNAKVAKKQLPTGTIRRPGIKAYKKTAKTNVSMTRKA